MILLPIHARAMPAAVAEVVASWGALGGVVATAAAVGVSIWALSRARKAAREVAALREKHVLQDKMISCSPAALFCIDPDGRVLAWSPSAERLFGWTEGEVLGRALPIVPEGRAEEFAGLRRRAVDGSGFTDQRVIRRRKDGSSFSASLSASPVLDRKGRVVGIVASMIDMSDRVAAEEALRESEARYRSLFEGNHAVMLLIDPATGDILDANPAASAFYGWTRDELRRMNISRINTLGPAELRREMARAHAMEQPRFFFRHRLADGSIRDVESIAGPIRVQGRDLLYSIVHDITARKVAEESRRRYEEMLARTERAAHVGSWEWDLTADVIRWSEELFHITGCDPGKGAPSLADHARFLRGEDLGILRGKIDRAIGECGEYSLELPVIRPDGEERHCLARGYAEAGQDGKTVRLYGFVQDLTERRRVEVAREQLQAAIDQAAECVLITDPAGRIQYVNPAFERVTGYSPGEVIGLNPRILKSGLQDAAFYREMWDTLLAGRTWRGEIINRRKDGTFFTEEAAISPVLGSSGEIISYTAIKHDITARKHAEERVAHLNLVLHALRDINKLITQKTSPGELIEEACRLLVDLRSYGTAIIVLLDGTGRPLQAAQAGVPPKAWEAICRIIESGELPRCLVHSGDHAVAFSREAGEGVCGNCPAADDCGKGDSLCARLVFGGRVYGYLSVYLEPDLGVDSEERSLFTEMAGDLAYALNSMEARAARLHAEHQRTEVERQLVESQKMEVVGQLAGGIAHDFNNILQGIIGYTEILLDQARESGGGCNELEQIAQGADRASSLTRQLLTFSRRQAMETKVLDPNVLIANLVKMLRRIIGEHIQFQWIPSEPLPSITADPSMLDQVLMNLCLNARDAMPRGGSLTISTAEAAFDPDDCEQCPWASPGRFIRLRVADTGMGIPEEVIEKIFEPFFTTKPEGRGTGLGLSIVYGIVHQHDGFLHVTSEPGAGSTFDIYLPVRVRGESSGDVPVNQPAAGGSETILLAEDDDLVRGLLTSVLQAAGYTVIEAHDGIHALRLFQENAGAVHLVVTDTVMPGMNGDELVCAIRTLGSNVPVLFCSGYNQLLTKENTLLVGDHAILRKPFTNTALLEHVRQVLDKTPHPTRN